MLCRRARNWISLAMDGELPPDRTVALTEHLEGCASCRAYRGDLQLGHRLIAATSPELAENFEWRLQLKLNQTLQGAAKTMTSPFVPSTPGMGRWFSITGLATAAGLAIVLGASTFALRPGAGLPIAARDQGPGESPVVAAQAPNPPGAGAAGVVTSTAGAPDRTALSSGGGALPWRYRSGGALGEPVNALSGGSWSGTSMSDLRTITSLREENQRLRAALSVAQREVEFMRTQLDTTGHGGVSGASRSPQ